MSEKKQPEPAFEDHLEAVESAVQRLEAGDVALEDSIDLYAEAMKHLAACRKVLTAAEERLDIVRRAVEGDPTAEPFEPAD